MRIEELKCDQFAGVQDRTVRFEEGLNLIFGRNESGKSSLVDLLYYLFFQDPMVDGRRDKDFREKAFPRTTGRYQGDSIDGTVRFSGKNGEYRLTKEWANKNGSSRLVLPDGTVIRDSGTISRILQEELEYGKGIYDEFVFSSQRRLQTVLQSLLGSKSSDAVKELTGTISKAVMETGGVDIDKMEAELDAIIKDYAGRWDFSADLPEGGKKRDLRNRWAVGAGNIVNAYYAMEEVRERRDNAEEKERAFENAADNLQNSKAAQKRAEEAQRRFLEVRSRLEQKNNLGALLEAAEREAQETAKAISDWPNAVEKKKQAERLKTDAERARKKEIRDAAAYAMRKLEEKQREAEAAGSVRQEDLKRAERSSDAVRRLEAQLAGLRLTAEITPHGTNTVLMRSLLTGKEKTVSGSIDISEAVDISVPGVAEIRLMPKDIDLSSIRRDLEQNRRDLKAVLEQYRVDSVSALQDKKSTADTIQSDLTVLTTKAESALQGWNWDALQEEVSAYPADLPTSEELRGKISALCGGSTIDACIGSLENMIRQYESRYGSIDALRERKTEAERRRLELRKNLEEVTEIPPEYAAVQDADQYAKDLQKRIDELKDAAENSLAAWSNAYKALDDTSAEEYTETLRQKQLAFEEQKTACRHWMHIQEVFLRLKSEMKGNPVAGIENSFRKNLAVLSGSRISLEQINDTLDSKIVSDHHPLSVEILSDGTKDTILLAFRLAVLEHLYPNGGAVAVFDDPFTDMDPERVREACGLITGFAEKNQVIFLTCDDKYCTLLDGNHIEINPRA